MFSCLMGERELGCIGIWVSWGCSCALLYLSIFIVKFLCYLRGGKQFAEPSKFLLFNFRLLLLLIWVLGCYLHNKLYMHFIGFQVKARWYWHYVCICSFMCLCFESHLFPLSLFTTWKDNQKKKKKVLQLITVAFDFVV